MTTAFTVHAQGESTDFPEGAKFKIAVDNGVLEVIRPDGSRRRYSPSGWDYVDEPARPPRPARVMVMP